MKFRGSLNPAQRTEYINAVLCMIDKPTSLPAHEYPGARTRRDDFVAYASLLFPIYTWMNLNIDKLQHTHQLYTPYSHERYLSSLAPPFPLAMGEGCERGVRLFGLSAVSRKVQR